MTLKQKNAGFTLLELSIVLVIIGLIAGGIAGGAELIKNAERRAAIKRIQDFDTAYISFRDKFDALPGDMRDFQSYYPTCLDYGYTCNGNGNQRLDGQEIFRVLEHLSKSNFIRVILMVITIIIPVTPVMS